MENVFSCSELEQILMIAAKLPTMGINYVAQETGININSIYAWSCGKQHISAKNADILLNWLRNCRPDALEAAIILFQRGGKDD